MTVRDTYRSAALLLILCVAVAILSAAQFSAPAHAQSGAESGANPGSIAIGLKDIPATDQGDPRAQTYIVDHLAPGTTISRRVTVSNFTDAPQIVDVYVGPATVQDGSFVPEPRGAESLLTRWSTIDTPELHLQPGESADVTVTIAVPADAPQIEQYAGIWASHATLTSESGMNQVSRVGVRVYLSVGGGNGPPSDFDIIDLRPIRDALGIAAIAAIVHNAGQRAIDVNGTLDLTEGPGGLSTAQVSSEYTTIGPGETVDILFPLPDSASLPAGPWQAQVELNSGVHKHDITSTLTFPEPGQDAVSQSKNVPWVTVLALAALALAGVLLLLLMHRRRSHSSHAADATTIV